MGIDQIYGQKDLISAEDHYPQTSGLAELTDWVFRLPALTLSQISSVKLMDRMDTKYLLHSCRLIAVLDQLDGKYLVMEINGIRSSAYTTLYFDDPNLHFYRDHVNRKLNRCKVRERRYVESNLNFLEVKSKTNKGKTLKKRVVVSGNGEPFPDEAIQLVRQYAGADLPELLPVLINRFKRITLVNRQMTERVTIDYNLSYQKSADQRPVILPGLVIIEVKQEKSGSSPIREVLFREKIRKTGISKYCVGIALTRPEQKLNRMKMKIRKINKIMKNEYSTYCN